MNELMQQVAGKRTGTYYLSRLAVVAICAVLALASFFALSSTYSSIDSYEHEVAVLDEKRATATELSIAAVGASAGITMIPDDACTPIANELAEIGKDLAIISGVILLEKYLMTITGYAFFKALVPLCLALFAIGYWKDANDPMRSSLLNGASKLVAWAKVVLTQVTEGFAVLVVTSCIVPVAMPLIAYWLVKVFFQPSGAQVAVLQLPPQVKALAAPPEADAHAQE